MVRAMEFIRLVIAAIVCAAFCVSAQAQGHYQLKYSDLLQNCSFVHRDEFSLDAFQELIKSQLQTRIDGDNVCQSAFRAMNANLENMLKLIDQNVSAQDARKLYGEMYGEYLVSLQTELTLLNPADPTEASRAQTLQGQIDNLRQDLLANNYEIRLYDRTSTTTELQQGQQQLFSQISGLVQSLATMPTDCASKIGGWQQVMPAILNATSFIGMATGQLYLPAAAAGIQVGTEVAMILKNHGVKQALNKLVAQKNNQILACTYQAITNQACELKRAAKAVEDTPAVLDIINNRYIPGQEGDYQKFERVQRMMPKVRDIIRKVGDMGSAVTLDLNLLFSYFTAVRVRPYDIDIPAEGSNDGVLARWLSDLSTRGISVSSTDSAGNTRSIKERYQDAVEQITNYKLTIETTLNIIREKRSFKDLRDELVVSSINLSNELAFIDAFLKSFPREKTEIPRQYIALFKTTERMLKMIREFVDVVQEDGEGDEAYNKRVEEAGDAMFAEFSYGSVAQVTTQTALMIPAIAIERFERPLRAIENVYLNQDIEERENPAHNSYASYTIERAVRVRILNMYKNLSASGQAFRLESFETTKASFERGFKKEIRQMIEGALEQDSPILGGVLKGRTAAHMCALFADHLRRENPRLLARCERAHGKLPLYQIMSGYRRPIEMAIDYKDPCFYSNYRREEYAQSLLYDRLMDYAFNKRR
jgi:predicted phage tail protein